MRGDSARFTEIESRVEVAGGLGGGMGCPCLRGADSVGDDNVVEPMAVMVAQPCDCA